jgi:hypothetical protein
MNRNQHNAAITWVIVTHLTAQLPIQNREDAEVDYR